jgi:hypothetical protein
MPRDADNLGRRSPRELTPGLDQLQVGQRIMTIFHLASFEPDRHLSRSDGHRRRYVDGPEQLEVGTSQG